eukprot:TRINITY_DN16396_c0_g1_i1.p2 TRINITY_DN16396_c0_g1~~TRINITY_DN16396_c0_g1_i1.p2  ORF type:complete len:192 (+),score=18.08 TRINITY_DN16396_c0_g1_i1:558-1133(+)
MYGYIFLYETYLYHMIRKDNRHNFSIYFYYIYLNYDEITKIQSILTFLPQVVLVFVVGLKLYQDLPFCLFLQTFLFVIFNKVCTAQYFIWYMCYLPFIIANSQLYKNKQWSKLFTMVGLWFGSEMFWNSQSIELEINGYNRFFYLWIASILFFLVNTFIVLRLIWNQKLQEFQLVQRPIDNKKLDDQKKSQ